MNIKVHIERLILDDITVPHRHRPLLQAALEEELARLLASDGLSIDFQQSHVQQSVRAGILEIKDSDEPAVLGRKIARALYEGVGK